MEINKKSRIFIGCYIPSVVIDFFAGCFCVFHAVTDVAVTTNATTYRPKVAFCERAAATWLMVLDVSHIHMQRMIFFSAHPFCGWRCNTRTANMPSEYQFLFVHPSTLRCVLGHSATCSLFIHALFLPRPPIKACTCAELRKAPNVAWPTLTLALLVEHDNIIGNHNPIFNMTIYHSISQMTRMLGRTKRCVSTI